ncbi:response regulator [Candidatus Uhrbacteria bacterium]|nr:response regulator [Candidatus Uhrbacteria bacterium]
MPGKKYKIAIVEDDAMLLKYLSSSLRAEQNFEVFTATNGEDGENMILDCKPDIVLLDIIMPKKNGFEVLEAIRKNPDMKNTSIVMLSNLGQGSDKDQAKKLGAVDYWVKVDMEVKDIVEKVKNFLKK